MTRTLNEAQLYWDSQDSDNAGWYLRYHDERGVEQGHALDADEDATTEELAQYVVEELRRHWQSREDADSGTIRVYRGDEPRGRITLEGGVATDRADGVALS